MFTARALRWLPAASVGLVLGSASAGAEAAEPDVPDSMINDRDRPVAFKLHAELGFIAPLYNRLQLGSDSTYVDLRRDLGQDTLYFFGRLSGDLDIGARRRHTVSLLWQPLDIRTESVTGRDLTIEGQTIPAGTPMQARYGFPFWRLSYLFDIFDDSREVAFGLGLQIRNANLELATSDGTFFRSARDVGPVPLLAFRGRGYLARRFWMGSEVHGFYAPIRYINGGASDVEGAIADASLRWGLTWDRGIDTFLNLRYLGGGAQGTSSDAQAFSDGFTRNWLHTVTVSVGFSVL